MLCILAKKNESVAIFRLIKMIDPQAFVSQSSVIGVYGEGFDRIKVNVPKKLKKKQNIPDIPPVANDQVDQEQNNKA